MTAKITTIERHILEQQQSFPDATGELTYLLYDIALAARIIAREVNKAGLVEILGSARERAPLFIGSREDVDEVEQFIREFG